MMFWEYSDRYLTARAVARSTLITLIVALGLAACQPLPPPSIRAATPRPADVTPQPTLARAEMADGPGLPGLLGSYPSLNGAWQAEVIRYDCADTGNGQEMALDVLRLIRTEDDSETVVARQVQYCGGLGAFGLGGLFWSSEGRYFYYTTAREGQPDGGCRPWVPPIARVDMENPRITAELAEAVRSPDGAKLAGWQAAQGDEGGRELVVWDVDGAEVLRAAPASIEGVPGPVIWSADGTRLVYPVSAEVCPPVYTQLIGVSLPDGQPEMLLEPGRAVLPGFVWLAWDGPDALVLEDEAGAPFRLDLATGTLAPAR